MLQGMRGELQHHLNAMHIYSRLCALCPGRWRGVYRGSGRDWFIPCSIYAEQDRWATPLPAIKDKETRPADRTRAGINWLS